jgi:hypothetical protein
MSASDQAVWQDYAQRKRAERMAEAARVWEALVAAGGTPETVLAVDFVHFGTTPAQAEALHDQLAQNYSVTVESGPNGYALVKGTTRPYGITLTRADHLDWVGFMCDVAQSHGCVFSTWSLAAPSLGATVSSEAFEAGG